MRNLACPVAARPITRQFVLVIVLVVLLLGLQPPAADAGPAGKGPTLPSPSGWPLAGVPTVVKIFDPPAEKWGAGHRGVDLAAQVGAQVLAAAGGTVSFAGPLAGRGVVVVDHGTVRTTYEPVTASVTVGATVTAGDPIGTLQSGGHCSRRACLHWGLIEDKTYLDPLLLIAAGAGAGTKTTEIRLLPRSAKAKALARAATRKLIVLTVGAQPSTGVAQFAGSNSARPAPMGGFIHPVSGSITSQYGMRFHPVLHVWKLHDGTDFGAGCGTPIRAAAAGVISQAYFNAGYGNRLMIDHGTINGHHVVTGYNHAIRYVVPVGSRVRQGQLIGFVGTTGYSTGCHLHLMAWVDGSMINAAGLLS